MAGEIVMRKAREKGVQVLPVDSEHNAIFQCLQSGRGLSGPNSRSAEAAPTFQSTDIRRIILTASGGSLSGNAGREIFGNYGGRSAQTSDLEHGAEDHDRFGHVI
jgi:1-deoxy-D-xylulose 5-phosphate reductoisomerase